MPLIGAQGPGSNIAWRGNLDEYPDAFSFVEVTEVFPGTAATCSPVTITGINYKALLTANLNTPAFAIDAGIGASVRVTPYIEETDSYGPAGEFLPGNDPNNPIIIRNKDKIELEVLTLAPGVVGRSAFAVGYGIGVTIGTRPGVEWFARTRDLDDDPDPFDFTDLSNLEINTLTVSDTLTITGIDDTIGVDIFIVGNGELRINGTGSWVQTAKIFDGDTLQLRNTTSNFYSTTVETVVQLGIFQANWNITTRAADTTINDFTFNDVINADINTIHESNTVTISGADDNLNGNNPLPLSFSGNGQYRITRGGSVVQEYTNSSSNTCNNGDVIQLKQTASGSYSTKTDATLTVANQSDTYSVTTRPRPIDTIPDQFTFTDQTGVLRNEIIYSNIITLSGMTAFGDEGTATINGTSGSNAQYKVVRGGSTVRNWTSGSFAVQLGDKIQLRLLSATDSLGSRDATFTVSGTNTFTNIGGVAGSTSDTWRVTSKARDCAINSFSLPNIPEGSSTLNPGALASTEFTIGGGFEFDCNVSATTSNSNSYLKKKGTTQQGTTLTDLKQGDVVQVFMTTPYYCSTRTTTVSLSAAFTTPGSARSANWTISPKAPPKPTLSLTANPINPAFVFPDGGSSTISYEYTHVTNSSVTTNFGVSSVPVTTLGDQTKNGSKGVSSLPSGTNKFTMTVSNCTGSTSDSVSVIVGTPPAPTLFFCVNQTATSSCPTSINIARGSSVTFRWNSTNAIKVEATRGTGFSTGNKQSGSDTATPSSDGEVYTAKATGAGASPQTVSKSITVRFSPSVTLSASPKNVITGNTTKLTWSSSDADRVTASSGPSFSGITALSGNKTITMNSSGTYTWSITVKDDGTNTTAKASASVTVTDDTTVDSFNMDPSSRSNQNLGSSSESQPKFTSSPTGSVHGLSPGISVTAKVSGGGAKFTDGNTSKTVKNGTSCSSLRIKMNASNSYSTSKTATLNIGGVSRTYKVTTKACVVENGTYSLDGMTLNTRRLLPTNAMCVRGGSGSGNTGGKREQSSTGGNTYGAGSSNWTAPTGTSSVTAKVIGAGGGGGKGDGKACGNKSNKKGCGGGGGGGGGASSVTWNQAESGDTFAIRIGSGGAGKSGNEGTGASGGKSYIEINGARTKSRVTANGGSGGGGGSKSSPGGAKGNGNVCNGRNGGDRRGDEGGHGGGAGRTSSSSACSSGQADPGSQPCDQGGPGQGSNVSGSCNGSNRQEKGTKEGANGHKYGGGGSGGGCGNGGGRGGDGRGRIEWTISYAKYSKISVAKKINQAYWDDIGRAATGGEIKTWYNRFKDDPATYPTLNTLYTKVKQGISGSTSNPRDNCGNSFPKWT